MVNTFDKIKIFYERKKKDVFGYIAEFFKLCGIFVVGIAEGEVNFKDYLSSFKRTDGKLKPWESERWKYELSYPVIHLCDYKANDKKDILSIVLKQVFHINSFSLMDMLENVYDDNNLFYHNTLERYYYSPSTERLISSYVAFRNTYEELEQLNLEYDVPYMQFFDYFRMSCKSKMNSFCDMLRFSKDFTTERLINEALRLSITYEGFYQGQILAGLIADKDIKYSTLSRGCYSVAMNAASKEVQGYLHYKLARYYEKVERAYDAALEECQEAVKILPKNIRIIYKKGIMEYRLGMINAACMDFQNICDLLSDALEVNCLEPIEIEYLLKSYSMLRILYSMWLMEKGSAQIVAEKIAKLEEVIDRDIYFENAFEEDAAVERELLKKHLNLKQGYANEQKKETIWGCYNESNKADSD